MTYVPKWNLVIIIIIIIIIIKNASPSAGYNPANTVLNIE
jgi:hypothetical protein